MRIGDLAEWLAAKLQNSAETEPAAELIGDPHREIDRVTALEDAGPHDLTFASGRLLKSAPESRAGCLLVPRDYHPPSGQTVIRVRDPRRAAAFAIALLHPLKQPQPGIHPTAVLGPAVVIKHGASIGPHVTIGAGTQIGEGTSIGAGCAIGDSVRIGRNCQIHPNVSIYREVVIGDSCIIHCGAVIGADGFGFVMSGGAHLKFPQIGRVEIGDSVEIGANTCVDRAALGVTSIGEGTKLDNQVHVGHNCRIGKHVVVAAQTGFSGGVVVEDYAVIGGQVGVGDKARIESRAIVGSGAGILTSKIVRAGEPVWGTPARPLKQHLRQLAALARLGKK